MNKQPELTDVICYGIIVLLGQENRDWEYYETDPDWWTCRLWLSRN
jgi:hypothetical protein